jgi:hypothetical protein
MQRIYTSFMLTAVIALTSFSGKAQYYYYDNHYYDKDVIWEIGTSVGLMTGITDVGGKKGIMPSFKSSQLNGSFYVGALYQNLAGVRFEATWGRIAGADSNGSQKKRNLSFRTPIREVAIIGEFHPLMLRYYDQIPSFSPYIALGMGWFSFNPQANLNGNWIDLQPLRTEGQGFPQKGGDSRPYKLSQSNIITGLGVKYDFSRLLTARAELLFRYTFTDYLDDVSTTFVDPSWFDANLSPQAAALAKQLYDRSVVKDPIFSGPGAIRGGVDTNDHYFTFNIKLAINLGRQPIER